MKGVYRPNRFDAYRCRHYDGLSYREIGKLYGSAMQNAHLAVRMEDPKYRRKHNKERRKASLAKRGRLDSYQRRHDNHIERKRVARAVGGVPARHCSLCGTLGHRFMCCPLAGDPDRLVRRWRLRLAAALYVTAAVRNVRRRLAADGRLSLGFLADPRRPRTMPTRARRKTA